MLYTIKGNPKKTNNDLIMKALKVAPAIFVDAANCANIHLFPTDKAHKLFVLPAESLYRYKPTLLKLPYYAKKLNAKQIFISTSEHLFDYDNPEENLQVKQQCEKIIKWIAKDNCVTWATQHHPKE